MYEYIRGTVQEVTPSYLVLDNQGIGYHIFIANPFRLSTLKKQEATIFIYQSVTQDDIRLYGFINKEEKELFLKLIGVSGIGPKSALAILAAEDHVGLVNAIENNDVTYLQKFPGVGKKTAEKMRQINIYTIGDLAKADVYALSQMLGINGKRLIQRANGIDPRRVDPDSVHDFKSIGNSTTLRYDTVDEVKIKQVLANLTERVEERLYRRQLKGKTVQLMIRYANRKTITRSRKLPKYVQTKKEIFPVIIQLLDEHWTRQPVRLLGVTVQDLLEEKYVVEQLDLFTYKERNRQLKIEKTVEQ